MTRVGAIGGIAVVLLGAIAGLVAYFLIRKPKPADVAWLAGGAVPSADAAAFYRSYLRRQLRFRGVGGLIGVAFALILSVRYGGGLTFFAGGAPVPLADCLFMGMAGVIVGGLAAESYRIGAGPGRAGWSGGPGAVSSESWRSAGAESRTAPAEDAPPEPPRDRPVGSEEAVPCGEETVSQALLAERGHFAPAGVVLAARATLAASAVVALVNAVTGFGIGAVVVVVICAVPAGLAEWTQRAVRDRRRLVLPPEVMAADEAVRRFAGRATAWLELAIGLLVVGQVLPVGDFPTPVIVAESVLGFASLGLSIWAFLRSRVRAPRALRRSWPSGPGPGGSLIGPGSPPPAPKGAGGGGVAGRPLAVRPAGPGAPGSAPVGAKSALAPEPSAAQVPAEPDGPSGRPGPDRSAVDQSPGAARTGPVASVPAAPAATGGLAFPAPRAARANSGGAVELGAGSAGALSSAPTSVGVAALDLPVARRGASARPSDGPDALRAVGSRSYQFRAAESAGSPVSSTAAPVSPAQSGPGPRGAQVADGPLGPAAGAAVGTAFEGGPV
ncbi:MAG: hypothetical protein LBG60_11075 [Bifidobacteriaceae bacterium]|jgi:hypothetical protein|nr:hypothetical protein [Bifidobacteriaceae bacterium]